MQVNTCTRVSADWKYNINIKLLINLHVFIVLLITKSRCFATLRSVPLLMTGKISSYLHSANIITNVGSCGDGLQINWKSNETSTFAQRCQGRWVFFLDLELENAIFHFSFIFLKCHRFHWATSLLRNALPFSFLFFLFSYFKGSTIHLSMHFTVLESLLS